MKFRWPFGSNAGPSPSPDAEEAEALHEPDDDLLSEDHPPSSLAGRRAVLIAGLVLAVALAVWLRWPSGPALRSPQGPTSNPLLAVGPITPPPQAPAESSVRPEPNAPAPPDVPPRPGETRTPARPTYFAPLPPPSGIPAESGSALPQQVAAMGWDLAKKERESRLAELAAKQTELRAKSKEAEVRIEEAEAWIQAIRKNPRLVLRSTPGIEGKVSGVPLFEVPPPPPSFPHASGPLVVPPKPVAPSPVPPERSPTASEIFVRMIDGSGPVPEAMVSVGPASYVVRAGDPIGAWQVTAIGPNGIWIKAGPSERVWRPLLARGSIPAEPSRPSSGVPAAPPAAAAPQEHGPSR